MINLIYATNYEHTLLENDTFPFNCFYIPSFHTLPHWHNHTEIIYIASGTSEVYINGSLYLCEQGTLVVTPHGSLHSILPIGSSNYYAILIGDTLLKTLSEDHHLSKVLNPILLNNNLTPFHIPSDHSLHNTLLTSIQLIIQEAQNKQDYSESVIKLELCRFITQLVRHFSETLVFQTIYQSTSTQNLKKAMEYLSGHYHEKITIADMGHLMNMSEQHFCRLFKSFTGKTFIEYLTLYRLEQANKLLLNTTLPITQIPELTGFCNTNYFSRVYKCRYGQPPSQTRKRIK